MSENQALREICYRIRRWGLYKNESDIGFLNFEHEDGRMFGGPCNIRMNVALPKTKVREAIARFDAIISSM